MSEVDLGLIRHALETASTHGYRVVEVEVDGVEFEARLESPGIRVPAPVAELTAAAEQTPSEPEPTAIRSALVGFFNMGTPPLEVGRHLKSGDLIGTVTALGIKNDVEATVAGEIVDVGVTDGQPVEFGQMLARVKVEV